jgi:hypothetical protein
MIKQAHAEAKDGHVKAKYEWLAGYHNEIAVRYTPSPVALCNLKTA